MRAIRVAAADDDEVFREALADMVRSDARFVLVGTASSHDDIVHLVAVEQPDLVLLDVRMPGGGPEAARALTHVDGELARTGVAGVPVVVAVSAQSGPSVVLAMLRAGASGYLVKGEVGDDLPDLLVRCAAGEVVLAVPGATEALHRLVVGCPTR